MGRRLVALAIMGVLCLALSRSNLFGQASERGTITGVVRDATGAVVPGAKVAVTNTATNVVVDATSNSVGEFTVPVQTSGKLAPNTGKAPGTVGYVQNNYSETQGTNVYPINKYSFRGDHTFNDNQRISGYFGDDREHYTYGPDGPPTLPGLYSNDKMCRCGSDRHAVDLSASSFTNNDFHA